MKISDKLANEMLIPFVFFLNVLC